MGFEYSTWALIGTFLCILFILAMSEWPTKEEREEWSKKRDYEMLKTVDDLHHRAVKAWNTDPLTLEPRKKG